MLNAVRVALLALIFVALPALAVETEELTKALDAYNAAVKAKDVPQMLALRAAERREQMGAQLTDAEKVETFLLSSLAVIPDRYTVQHVSWNDEQTHATLFLLSDFSEMEQVKRPQVRMEEWVSLRKEEGGWKVRDTRLLSDPSKLKALANDQYDPAQAKDGEVIRLAGRVIRVEYRDDHTLLVLRGAEEERAVFLPPKELLEQQRVPLEPFAPWKIHEFVGHAHKSDAQKFFAKGGRQVLD